MAHPPRLAFGPFELDPATCELRRDGDPVPLQRQPARVLAALVTRAGTLVTRDELRAAVWADDTHVDFDRGINYCIRHLRAALDDAARSPRYIETVARQGYRFVAAVSTPHGQEASIVARRRWAGVAAVAAAAVTVVVEATGNPETHHRVAVAILRTVHDLLF